VSAAHAAKLERLRADLAARAGAPVALAKDTSNLFRDRRAPRAHRIDVRGFQDVLALDAAAGRVQAEGMTTYGALVDACLASGVMPAVVPQLRSITIGGAVAGVGIEATSFRHGLVHHTLLELEVLAGTGEIVRAAPDGPHAGLFFGFPNSYGTLGYALGVTVRTLPVKSHVEVAHRRFETAEAFFEALAAACRGDADFVDGVVFDRGTLVLSTARFVEGAPYASDYSYERIYYRSLLERETDYLGVRDYLWRWDTDWFWCSKNLLAQQPLVRRLYGRKRLNSVFYTKVMRWNSRLGFTRLLDVLHGLHGESVIQDVDVPLARAPEFLEFLHREIGLLPVWVCPIGNPRPEWRFPLYPMESGEPYVNFGFWDVKRTRERHSPGHFNRLIERKVIELGGIKSLYSDSFFTAEEFARLYGGEAYAALKARYDPDAAFPGLYAKCVLRE
jgi:FAD/FMN-containing dehydrogenase